MTNSRGSSECFCHSRKALWVYFVIDDTLITQEDLVNASAVPGELFWFKQYLFETTEKQYTYYTNLASHVLFLLAIFVLLMN